MNEIRLTITYGRVTGLPHRPDTYRKGGQVSEDFPHWEPAIDRLTGALRDAAAEGRPIRSASLTDLRLARKNEVAAQRGNAQRGQS